VKVRYLDREGVERAWEAIERVNCEGIVVIVPFTRENDVLLIRQFRPAVNRNVVEFPAGLIDTGEATEHAARRELREETGYDAEQLLFLAEGPLASGSSNGTMSVYLATGLVFKGISGRDETEDIEVLRIPSAGIEEAIEGFRRDGFAVDLKVFGFVDLAKRKLGLLR
jgi:8-oxo-dGTP pyrophosphatase MutT (NUDIX family)